MAIPYKCEIQFNRQPKCTVKYRLNMVFLDLTIFWPWNIINIIKVDNWLVTVLHGYYRDKNGGLEVIVIVGDPES